ncbi:MAG: insulinase family protein [Ruminococcus sp.]|nr:insulinase family protein [Ruminococcus sp.]
MRETVSERIVNERTGDGYTVVHHKSGLDLLLYPMEGYKFTSAMFSTDYGSINNCFKTDDDEDFVTVPDGIAHYLEHKLFENEDCDAFAQYAATGADGNAMTGYENTTYLFTCTENFYDSLKILLSFVQNPYFTEENVRKEQGIISQEIRMTLDIPRRRCFHELLKAMYSAHPVRIDIGGTEESIAQITPELLYKCYHAFYDLNNMVLTAAGNFEIDKVIEICDELLKPCEDKHLEIRLPEEPKEIAEPFVKTEMGLGMPIFTIGFKCPAFSGMERLEKEMQAYFALELLAGSMSPLFKRLTDGHLIGGGLGRQFFAGKGYFSLLFDGESEQPEKVAELILEAADEIRRTGFDKEEFELMKRAEFGDLIKGLDNPEACTDGMLSYYFLGLDMFAEERLMEKLTIADVEKFLDDFIRRENMVISVVN